MQSTGHRPLSMRDLAPDPRIHDIRLFCGFRLPVVEMWAMRSWSGGLDLYVQAIGQEPVDVFLHYHLDIAEPSEWWRARDYDYRGKISMPEWAPAIVERVVL